MAGNDLQLLNGLAQDLSAALGNIAVRGAVEAVTTHLVVLVVLIGNGIGVSLCGHGLMERGVEHGNHGNAGHLLLAGLDADDVGGVVERSQGVALLNGSHNLVGDDHGGSELLAAMDHTVANCVDLLHGSDYAVLGIHQSVEHGCNGLGMGGHCHVNRVQLFLALDLGLVGELTVDADALAQALCQKIAGGGIQQLVLEGGAAGIDN